VGKCICSFWLAWEPFKYFEIRVNFYFGPKIRKRRLPIPKNETPMSLFLRNLSFKTFLKNRDSFLKRGARIIKIWAQVATFHLGFKIVD